MDYENYIDVDNISFNYKEKIVFENLSIKLQSGVYWLRGANGSGKSTFLKILSTAIKPTTGEIFCFGKNINQLCPADQQRIFLCEDEFPELPWLKAYEFFRLYKCIYRTTERSIFLDNLNKFKLTEKILNISVTNLSLGERKKLYLATAFSSGCDFIILDEPFNGLDSESSEFLQELILNYSTNDEKLIIFTSHTSPIIDVKSIELIGGYNSKIIKS